MKQVFISYSSNEKRQADEIVEALEKQGIQCWIAPRDIGIGSDYIDQIPEGIDECPYFLVLLSPKSQVSQWVKIELSQAVEERKCIFPLLLEDFTISRGFKFLLHNTQIRPYFEDKDTAIQEIITRIPGQPLHTNSAEECYQKGENCYNARKYEEAVTWYCKAAEQGHIKAHTNLGYCYDKGYGVPHDLKAAMEWYRKGAEKGDRTSQYNLALCYEKGAGIKKNLAEAVKWYQKSADQGYARAQFCLGFCYYLGQGTPQSKATAFKWFLNAAEQGLAEAQHYLGVCFDFGFGAPKSDESAAIWYQKAALQGYADAQCKLGECYEFGKGVRKDLTEAKKWYQKAAEQSNEDAMDALEWLK